MRLLLGFSIWLVTLATAAAVQLEEVADFRWDAVDDESVRAPQFGWQVVSNGDWAVVSAPQENDFLGQLYLFRFEAAPVATWRFQKALEVPTDISVVCRHGLTLTMDDEWLLAGSNGCGGFLFQRDRGGANNWGYLKRLFTEDTATRRIEQQGSSVTISADTIAIGAPGTDYAPSYTGDDGSAGVALLYQRTNGGANNWGLAEVIDVPASDQVFQAEFGQTISLDGDTLVVGSPAYPTDGVAGSGRAWIFSRDNDSWLFRTAVSSDQPEVNSGFAESIEVRGDLLIAGSPNGARELTPGTSNDGSVYTFQRNFGGVGSWGLVEEIVPSTPIGEFGVTVSLELNLMLVGSPDNSAGGAWLFERRNGLWTEIQAIQRPMFRPWYDFGMSVDLVRRGARIHAVIGDPLFEEEESTEFFKPRLGKAFFYLYDDGLFSDGFE